jgi:heme exporter protein A
MLTLNKINYSKNHQKIICDLGFSAGLNSCITLKGKNGSGKTTLLKIIAGLNEVNSKNNNGELLWNNKSINHIKEDFYSDLQYIGHEDSFKSDLTILENLLFYTRINESELLIASAVRYFKLDNFIDIKLHKLSAGMRKKVALAKLLCCPATIWLLDEPTINLDKESRELLFNLVSTRIKENGIVIIATHDDLFKDISAEINLDDFKK